MPLQPRSPVWAPSLPGFPTPAECGLTPFREVWHGAGTFPHSSPTTKAHRLLFALPRPPRCFTIHSPLRGFCLPCQAREHRGDRRGERGGVLDGRPHYLSLSLSPKLLRSSCRKQCTSGDAMWQVRPRWTWRVRFKARRLDPWQGGTPLLGWSFASRLMLWEWGPRALGCQKMRWKNVYDLKQENNLGFMKQKDLIILNLLIHKM